MLIKIIRLAIQKPSVSTAMCIGVSATVGNEIKADIQNLNFRIVI